MLFILTKTGPWKIPGDLCRVLGNSSYCSTSEISRKGSWHQESLLTDYFFGLKYGERRRKEWFCFGVQALHPCVVTPTTCCLSSPASADINRNREWKGRFFENKRGNEEGRIELLRSYVSFLGTGYFIAKGGTAPAKEIMRAYRWILDGLFVNNFFMW